MMLCAGFFCKRLVFEISIIYPESTHTSGISSGQGFTCCNTQKTIKKQHTVLLNTLKLLSTFFAEECLKPEHINHTAWLNDL